MVAPLVVDTSNPDDVCGVDGGEDVLTSSREARLAVEGKAPRRERSSAPT